MLYLSSILWAFAGPTPSLFVATGSEGHGAYQTLSGSLFLDSGGVRVATAQMHFGVTTPPEGVLPEGEIRFVGSDTMRRLATYRAVQWEGPGMQVRITALTPRTVEIQFFLDAGETPDRASVNVSGGRWVPLDAGVGLVGENGDTLLRLSSFRAFQGVEERAITVRISPHRLGFQVAPWDPALPLVIDPITAIITGTDSVRIHDVKAAPDGNSVYVAGAVYNRDPGFSVSPVVYGTASTPGCSPGCWDAFVTHLSADLSTHLQTVVLTSAQNDQALDMAVESSLVAIAGWTDHTTSFATGRTVWGTSGGQDAFVVVMDTALSSVLHTLIVATPDTDRFHAVDFDTYAHIWAGGYTRDGGNVPVATAPQIYGTPGDRDAFIASFSIAPTPVLMASAVLAGTATSAEVLEDLAQEPLGGTLYATGHTTAGAGFAGGPFGTGGILGGSDAFFAQLPQDLTGVTSWVEGTAADEFSRRVMPDPTWGSLYFAGYTADGAAYATLPATVHGPRPSSSGASFVVRTYPTLTPRNRAILTGSSGNGAHGLAVMPDRVIVAGRVYGASSFGPSRQIYGNPGGAEAYLTVLDTALNVHHGSAILASPGEDQATGVVLTSPGFVVGGFVGTPATFAESPPTYVYGSSTPGPRAFVSLLPGNQVQVTEDRTGSTPAPSLHLQTFPGRIVLRAPRPGYLALEIRDGAGRLRALQVWGFVPPGSYAYAPSLRRGIYLLRVRHGETTTTRTLWIP